MSHRDSHPLEDLIPDYLNGKLDTEAAQRFESELERDEDLRQVFEMEQQIKAAILKDKHIESGVNPDFASFQAALEQPQRTWLDWRWLLAPALAFSLVLLVQLPES